MNSWRKLTITLAPQYADFLKETTKRRLIGKNQLLNDVLYNWYGTTVCLDNPVLQKEAMEIKI